MNKSSDSFLHVYGRYGKLTALLLVLILCLEICACQRNPSVPELSVSPCPSLFPTALSLTPEPVPSSAKPLPTPAASPAVTPVPEDPAEILLKSMTLDEKIGQLFFIRPEAISSDDSIQSVSDSMRNNYGLYPAGGFVLFGKNLKDPEQLSAFTGQLHAIGRIRPLLCIDEEGGTIARIGNHRSFSEKVFPDMGTIAGTGDLQKAFEVGDTIGAYLAKYGLDIDFAPVADLNTNPHNPVIGARAFGSDPELAGQMAAAVLDGLHAHGIGGCLKHFPGHGDTQTDTHTGYAETGKTWEELLQCEIIPFKIAMQSEPEMIMAAHIAAPNVTNSNRPASLSSVLLIHKLRNELGYQGIIITDALEMKAITRNYSSGKASVTALQAGADIILMPSDYTEAFHAVREAVTAGEISEQRLNESVLRILRLKLRF